MHDLFSSLCCLPCTRILRLKKCYKKLVIETVIMHAEHSVSMRVPLPINNPINLMPASTAAYDIKRETRESERICRAE